MLMMWCCWPPSLRASLLHLERIAALWGMAVNHGKTKVLVCAPDEGAAADAEAAEAAAAALAAAGRAAGQADKEAMAGGHAACRLQQGTLGGILPVPRGGCSPGWVPGAGDFSPAWAGS